jgi:hypothetical protein
MEFNLKWISSINVCDKLKAIETMLVSIGKLLVCIDYFNELISTVQRNEIVS